MSLTGIVYPNPKVKEKATAKKAMQKPRAKETATATMDMRAPTVARVSLVKASTRDFQIPTSAPVNGPDLSYEQPPKWGAFFAQKMPPLLREHLSR